MTIQKIYRFRQFIDEMDRNTPPFNYSKKYKGEYSFCRDSWQDALRLARYGIENQAKIEKIMSNMALLEAVKTKGFGMAETGLCVDVGTYLNGEPECWIAEQFDYKPKKVVRTKKTGLINEKMLDKLTVPYEVVTDDIDYSLANNIAQCIINLPYQKIKWGKRDRYEVDFKKWTKYTGIECNDYDAKFLNSLLETSLRQNSYWRSFYNNKENPTPAILSEKRRYQKSVYNTLLNAAKNKNDTYKKAYNFYLIYQAMINYDKDNNRGGYGK